MKSIKVRLYYSLGLIVVLLACFCVPISAEVKIPDWYDLQSRNLHYPRDVYYTGFVIGEPNAAESNADAMERIKRDSQKDAAASIRMKIESSVSAINRSELTQVGGDFDEHVTEFFESVSHINVNIEVPGLQTEVWTNSSTGEIAAFSFVRKAELKKKLDRQVTAGIARIEMNIENIESMIEANNKSKARDEVEHTFTLFDNIEQAQALLLSIGSDLEDLQYSQTSDLKQTLMKLQSQLKHGISVCLRMGAEWNGNSYDKPAKRIEGILSDLGCNFTTDTIGVDWIIDVNSVPRHYSSNSFGNSTTYTSYIDSHISIVQGHTFLRIYEDALSAKGVHTFSFDEADKVAYEEAVKQISEIIKEYIKQ